MNIDKFTQKSIEAVNGCEKLAMEYGNQEIEQEHLLYSLLTLDESDLKACGKDGDPEGSFCKPCKTGFGEESKGAGRSALCRSVSEQGTGQRIGRSKTDG